MAIALVSLYAGMSASFSVTKLSRENLRATQIMLERMEGIRLYTWDQLTGSDLNQLCPPTFTSSYYPAPLAGESTGITYYATVQITNANSTGISPAISSYGDQMKALTITVYWTNYYGSRMTNKLVRSRTMTTYMAKNGVQNYIFNN